MIGIVVAVVVIASGLLFGLAFLMRKRILKRRRFNAALVGSKPSRPFLDNELDDMPPAGGARDVGPGPVSFLYIFFSHFFSDRLPLNNVKLMQMPVYLSAV